MWVDECEREMLALSVAGWGHRERKAQHASGSMEILMLS
jgi:hypothetical protein